jgi:hypothetical protein
MPRFVLLEHDHPHLHWDLMLEAAGSLRTWRLAAPPTAEPVVPGVALRDHRLAYLTYEGPLSGGRGQVRQWDAGVFEWIDDNERVVTIRLRGARIIGVLRLEWQQGHDWSARLTSGNG